MQSPEAKRVYFACKLHWLLKACNRDQNTFAEMAALVPLPDYKLSFVNSTRRIPFFFRIAKIVFLVLLISFPWH
jgi:hypothetical protein